MICLKQIYTMVTCDKEMTKGLIIYHVFLSSFILVYFPSDIFLVCGILSISVLISDICSCEDKNCKYSLNAEKWLRICFYYMCLFV